jgi:hypothetical protein
MSNKMHVVTEICIKWTLGVFVNEWGKVGQLFSVLCVWWCVYVWMRCAHVSYKPLCNCLLELYRHNWHGAVQISFHNVESKYVRYMESPCHCSGFFLWCNIIHHWQKHTVMSNLLGISFRHVRIQIFNWWNGREDKVSKNGKKYCKKLKDSEFIPNIMINRTHLNTWLYLWQYTTICIEEWGDMIWTHLNTLRYLWYYHRLHHHYLHRGVRRYDINTSEHFAISVVLPSFASPLLA